MDTISLPYFRRLTPPDSHGSQHFRLTQPWWPCNMFEFARFRASDSGASVGTLYLTPSPEDAPAVQAGCARLQAVYREPTESPLSVDGELQIRIGRYAVVYVRSVLARDHFADSNLADQATQLPRWVRPSGMPTRAVLASFTPYYTVRPVIQAAYIDNRQRLILVSNAVYMLVSEMDVRPDVIQPPAPHVAALPPGLTAYAREPMCTVCIERPANCMFLPCGHICSCMTCASQPLRRNQQPQCFVCRAPRTTVVDMQRVFPLPESSAPQPTAAAAAPPPTAAAAAHPTTAAAAAPRATAAAAGRWAWATQ